MRVTHKFPFRKVVLVVALGMFATLGLYADPAALAQTFITGHFDGSSHDGYQANGPNTYIVGPDSADSPSATFNNNAGQGLSAGGGSTVTAYGGQFNANYRGIICSGSTLTVNGGQFSGNILSGIQAGRGATVIVTGGVFSGNGVDFVPDTDVTFDIYGQFAGLTPGQTQTLNAGADVGNFVGTLLNNTMPAQTFSYVGGPITLHDVTLTPEPSQSAALALGVLGIGGLLWRARKRRANDAA